MIRAGDLLFFMSLFSPPMKAMIRACCLFWFISFFLTSFLNPGTHMSIFSILSPPDHEFGRRSAGEFYDYKIAIIF
ncbi:MAG: hypothetical protein N2V72_00080 [Methanophagales archaeon]|nr:hypothetical protein [Methanophagales archaeon]